MQCAAGEDRYSTLGENSTGCRALLGDSFNDANHAVEVQQHVEVGEPQYAEVVAHQPCCPPLVVHHLIGLKVLTAVDLHNEASFQTNEIYEVRTERELASETQATDSFASQGSP